MYIGKVTNNNTFTFERIIYHCHFFLKRDLINQRLNQINVEEISRGNSNIVLIYLAIRYCVLIYLSFWQ